MKAIEDAVNGVEKAVNGVTALGTIIMHIVKCSIWLMHEPIDTTAEGSRSDSYGYLNWQAVTLMDLSWQKLLCWYDFLAKLQNTLTIC